MTAEARAHDPDPSDPAEILRLLPEHHHAQFLGEYAIAIEQARRPEQYRMLQELLECCHRATRRRFVRLPSAMDMA